MTTTDRKNLISDKLKSRVIKFYNELTPEDMAGLSKTTSDRPIYKHEHRSLKSKGGRPPKDYQAVDAHVDLGIHIKNQEWAEALTLYYWLRRLVQGE